MKCALGLTRELTAAQQKKSHGELERRVGALVESARKKGLKARKKKHREKKKMKAMASRSEKARIWTSSRLVSGSSHQDQVYNRRAEAATLGRKARSENVASHKLLGQVTICPLMCWRKPDDGVVAVSFRDGEKPVKRPTNARWTSETSTLSLREIMLISESACRRC